MERAEAGSGPRLGGRSGGGGSARDRERFTISEGEALTLAVGALLVLLAIGGRNKGIITTLVCLSLLAVAALGVLTALLLGVTT